MRVLTGDAAASLPDGPFDRVIATVGACTVPGGWVTALAEGGRLVLPLDNTYFPPGIAVLTRHGGAASGSLAGPADFMALRSARVPRRAVVGFKQAQQRCGPLNGADLPVAKTLRHSKLSITSDLYGHLTQEASVVAADTLGAVPAWSQCDRKPSMKPERDQKSQVRPVSQRRMFKPTRWNSLRSE